MGGLYWAAMRSGVDRSLVVAVGLREKRSRLVKPNLLETSETMDRPTKVIVVTHGGRNLMDMMSRRKEKP